MVNVKIDESVLLSMLIKRVKCWTTEKSTIALFEGYYQSMIDSGCFDGAYLDINIIVDNDYINKSIYDSIEEACKDLNCTPEGLDIEYQSKNGILVHN